MRVTDEQAQDMVDLYPAKAGTIYDLAADLLDARERIAQLEAKNGHRTIGGQGSHWDGCYKTHADCADALIEQQRERIVANEREITLYEAAYQAVARRLGLPENANRDDIDMVVATLGERIAALEACVKQHALCDCDGTLHQLHPSCNCAPCRVAYDAERAKVTL